MPLRVLLISHRADHTGAPKTLAILGRHLAFEGDVEARVLVGRDGPTVGAFTGFAPTDAWPTQVRHQRILAEELRAFGPDVVLSNTATNAELIEGLKLPASVPVVTYVHELGWTLDQLSDDQRSGFVGHSRRFLAASEATKRHLVRTQGVADGDVAVVWEALDLAADRVAAARLGRAAVEAQLGIPADAVLVGNAGTVGPRKGADLFVAAAERMLAEREAAAPPLFFVWLGDGPDRAELRQRIAASGLADRILLPGLRANPHPVLARLDLLLMSSRDDPFPRVVLEAGGHGVPCVAFAEAGGAAEFVAPAGEPPAGATVPAGLDPVELARAARELLSDPARLRRCGEAAAERAKTLDVGVLAPRVLAELRSVVPAPPPAHPCPLPGGQRRVRVELPEAPRVSVLMTSFNYGRYVGEAIASVAAQTVAPAQLLIVDDGSQDDSVERIREAIDGLPFEVSFECQENAGQAAALNRAFERANGDVIAFLDSDDRWEPNKLERMLALMRACPGGGLYQHQLGDGAGALKREVMQTGDVFRHWERAVRVNVAQRPNPVDLFQPTSGLLAHRSVLEGVFPLDPALITCPDALITRACVRRGPLVSHPEVLGIWRRHAENAGSSCRFGFERYWLPVVMPAINRHLKASGSVVELVCRPGQARPTGGSPRRPAPPRPWGRRLRPTKHNAVRLMNRLGVEELARRALGRPLNAEARR